MRFAKVFAAVLVVAVCASMASFAQEASERKANRPVKLVKPWSEITSLSEEQKSQIDQIHKEALAEIRTIRAKEREQILAVLSDDQKREAQRLISGGERERKQTAARE
jgi:hypothetical protein